MIVLNKDTAEQMLNLHAIRGPCKIMDKSILKVYDLHEATGEQLLNLEVGTGRIGVNRQRLRLLTFG